MKPVVLGGKLKLKGSSGGSKKRKAGGQEANLVEGSSGVATNATTDYSPEPVKPPSFLTETQRKQQEKKLKMDLQSAKSNVATYRDRVEQFNYKLATTTEHNDIPRISAAGNG